MGFVPVAALLAWLVAPLPHRRPFAFAVHYKGFLVEWNHPTKERGYLRSILSFTKRYLQTMHQRRFFMSRHESFNQSGFSKFLNSPAGRIFRLAAGTGFLVIGYVYRNRRLGKLSMVWSALPLSAGAFDICYLSAVLGGPLSGAKIRSEYQTGF